MTALKQFLRARRAIALFVVLCAVALPAAVAQDSFSVRDAYTKHEYMIPMRDGVRLFTAVYVPKDTTTTHPILMTRSPYSSGPYGANVYPAWSGNLRNKFFREGYIMVFQDVRGRYMSEGEFVDVRPYIPNKKGPKDIDESSDAYDTIDWLIKNVPRTNGRVGISGVSYPGFYSSMSAIDAHPALKAVSPQAPVSKWFDRDDFFHNGALLLPHAFNFYASFGWPRPAPKSEPDKRFDHGTPDEYKFFLELGPVRNADAKYFKGQVSFWTQLTQNGVWNDFWAERNILPHMKNIKPAVMVVGGWFDMENLFGALHLYEAIENQSPKTTNTLVMGPWSHGQWDFGTEGDALGIVRFGSKLNQFFLDSLEAPFFRYYLKGEGSSKAPEAAVFLTGTNEWRMLESWPPKNVQKRSLYLHAGGKLSFDPPGAGTPAYDEYISDPAKPVPYTSEIGHWYNSAYPVEDQRFASRRSDVLVYVSDVLSEDLTVAGPVLPSLFVSTSGTDSDWIVKVIDVYPDDTPSPPKNPQGIKLGGYEQLVRGDVIRGKFRNSLSKPEPFVPNKVTAVNFELLDVFHTFKKGHRVMVHIQSSWFPKIDRNPQTFVDIFAATESDFLKATQRVYHSVEFPTQITFGVLK